MSCSHSTKLQKTPWWPEASGGLRLSIQAKMAIATGLVAVLAAGLVAVYGLRPVELAVALLLSVAFGVVLGRHFTGPIHILDRCAGRVAQGDLLTSVEVSRRDELGDLAQRFNHMIARLRDNREALLKEVNSDALTGLYNQRYADEFLAQEMQRARRYDHTIAIALVDIDNFRLFNEIYGRSQGDQVLKSVAGILSDAVRSSDIVARNGGDDFILILPETGDPGVAAIAERILAEISGFAHRGADGERIPVTCSIGSALYPLHGSNESELFGVAESSVNEVRLAGGNGYRAPRLSSLDAARGNAGALGILEGLVEAVDCKDRYTKQHSEMVTRLSMAAADRLCLPEELRDTVRVASMLHDVGKLGIPNGILRKPGALTDSEYLVMKEHPTLGARIVQELPKLPQILAAIKHHHERYDGTGYPDGLRESEIPLISRIMAVADAYSAMTSNRPYRRSLGHKKAVDELRRGSGRQFDPDIVQLFLDIFDAHEEQALAASA